MRLSTLIFFAPFIAYITLQATLGSHIRSQVENFASVLEQSAKGPDGNIGPIGIPSGVVCRLLVERNTIKGGIYVFAIPYATVAADTLRHHHNFTLINSSECQFDGVFNQILVAPREAGY